MKISTFNICGWYSAINKGLGKWIKNSNIDILALQELRTVNVAKPLELAKYFTAFNPSKFQGTAIISTNKPLKIKRKLGYARLDSEGRFIQADFKNFIFLNVYLPHGGRDKKDLPYKLKSFELLIKYLVKLKKERKPIILAGDFNVAHTEKDLANPERNKNNIMFTEKERRQIDKILELDFVDSFRQLHKTGGYTWWLRAFDAKKRNIGWRIDYVFISKNLTESLYNAFVEKNLEISDHCPLVVETRI